MLTKKTFLIKNIIDKSVERSDIEGIFTLPFPIKEIFEVQHKILPVRSFIGEHCVAFFGEIETKTYCVDSSSNVRQLEHLLHYKGFAFFDKRYLKSKPLVKIQTKIEDLFVELDCDHLKIDGVVSTEIVLTLEKEICLEEHCYRQLEPIETFGESYDEPHETSQKNHNITYQKSKSYCESTETSEGKDDLYDDNEIITEVTSSNNTDVIITVE